MSRRKNPIWGYFRKVNNNPSKAECLECDKVPSLGSDKSRLQTVSGLKGHLSTCHKAIFSIVILYLLDHLSKNVRRINVTHAGNSCRDGYSDKLHLCVYLSIHAVKEKQLEQSTQLTDIQRQLLSMHFWFRLSDERSYSLFWCNFGFSRKAYPVFGFNKLKFLPSVDLYAPGCTSATIIDDWKIHQFHNLFSADILTNPSDSKHHHSTLCFKKINVTMSSTITWIVGVRL